MVVRVAAGGGFRGDVPDAGCGTGENALHIAVLGLPEPDRVGTSYHDGGAPAWFATVRRSRTATP